MQNNNSENPNPIIEQAVQVMRNARQNPQGGDDNNNNQPEHQKIKVLTLQEKLMISYLSGKGYSQKAIAKQLNRSVGAVNKVLKVLHENDP